LTTSIFLSGKALAAGQNSIEEPTASAMSLSNELPESQPVTQASRIAQVFAQRGQQCHLAFMPFLAAGDPDVQTTGRLIQELAAAGADLIEVGFPYSDPIADGPVIQSSYTRALNKRLKLKDIFHSIAAVSPTVSCPLVAMVSYAIIFRTGVESFVTQARDAGFSGLIVPDLPGDEASEFAALVTRHQMDLIQLVAPTTPADRAARILKNATGFVYCIAVAGTTGARAELAPQLADMLKSLRSQTSLPLAVGFGISRPEQVDQLRGLADGVIVGSAIVRHLEALATNCDPIQTDAVMKQIADYASSIAKAAHSA
jgi:tryptophan synthase alpha chain